MLFFRNTNDDVATPANCLEFPEDENEFDGDVSDSDGYLSEVCLAVLYRLLFIVDKQYSY